MARKRKLGHTNLRPHARGKRQQATPNEISDENGNHAISKTEAKDDCQRSDQPDRQSHVGREPECKQRTRTAMPLTGRNLLDPMWLYRQHLPTILASHFHRVLSRTDLAHRYLLCCQGLCPKNLTSRLLFGQVGILPKKMALCLTHTWIVSPHKYFGTIRYTAVN